MTDAPASHPTQDARPAASPPAPLQGVNILDLSQNLAGPFATQILADLGAEVIKVEPPGGDAARAWGPPFVDGESPLFLCANRNKRSIILDLQAERDRERLRRLATRCDIFVQAFRAGVIDRLGFGYAAVREINPSVVYLSVTAFGTEGPLRDHPGYDPLMQAFGGLMSVTGRPGEAPVRVGTSVVDMGTGMWSAIAVLAALQRRAATGEGCHVTSSLLDTTLTWMAYHLQGFAGTGAVPGPAGTGLGMIAPYQAFPARDGHVMIAAGNDATFRRLCQALGLEALARDPRFASNPSRVSHRAELERAVTERTRRDDVVTLVERLRHAAVPCSPIQDAAEVARDEQVAASGMLRPFPGDPSHLDVALPVRWDGARAQTRLPPPGAGEHTREILAELEVEPG
jgi:crotonobetainyl-CoA:carnitine CoA-transferase CaiB-like acyl-CoA transferase